VVRLGMGDFILIKFDGISLDELNYELLVTYGKRISIIGSIEHNYVFADIDYCEIKRILY
jgi:hypothetical protein